MFYDKSERETHINTDDTMDYWNVYTRQSKVINKMAKLKVEPYRVTKDEEDRIVEAEYKVDLKQIGFRKLVELTEEQKKARSEVARRNLHKENESEE